MTKQNVSQDTSNRNIFVVPSKDIGMNQYIHIEVNGEQFPAFQLSELHQQILNLLVQDKPLKDIEASLGQGYAQGVFYNIMRDLRSKFGVQSYHGLVAKVYQMRLDSSLF